MKFRTFFYFRTFALMAKRRRVSAPAPPSPILVIDLTSDNGNGGNHGGNQGGNHGGNHGGVIWSCSMCTYENAAADGVCEMCGAARPPPPPPDGSIIRIQRLVDALRGDAEARRRDEQRREDDRRRDEERREDDRRRERRDDHHELVAAVGAAAMASAARGRGRAYGAHGGGGAGVGRGGGGGPEFGGGVCTRRCSYPHSCWCGKPMRVVNNHPAPFHSCPNWRPGGMGNGCGFFRRCRNAT